MTKDGKTYSVSRASFFIGTCLLVYNAAALDWPQWRGPNRDGISTEAGWSSAWPRDGLMQVWKAEVGTGYGSMAVSRGRLFVMGNTADQDTVYCLDANTGREIWKQPSSRWATCA